MSKGSRFAAALAFFLAAQAAFPGDCKSLLDELKGFLGSDHPEIKQLERQQLAAKTRGKTKSEPNSRVVSILSDFSRQTEFRFLDQDGATISIASSENPSVPIARLTFLIEHDPSSGQALMNVMRVDVSPSHRRKGLTKVLYAKALTENPEIEVISCSLAQDNEAILEKAGLPETPAFKVRQSVGFGKVEEFNGSHLVVRSETPQELEARLGSVYKREESIARAKKIVDDLANSKSAKQGAGAKNLMDLARNGDPGAILALANHLDLFEKTLSKPLDDLIGRLDADPFDAKALKEIESLNDAVKAIRYSPELTAVERRRMGEFNGKILKAQEIAKTNVVLKSIQKKPKIMDRASFKHSLEDFQSALMAGNQAEATSIFRNFSSMTTLLAEKGRFANGAMHVLSEAVRSLLSMRTETLGGRSLRETQEMRVAMDLNLSFLRKSLAGLSQKMALSPEARQEIASLGSSIDDVLRLQTPEEAKLLIHSLMERAKSRQTIPFAYPVYGSAPVMTFNEAMQNYENVLAMLNSRDEVLRLDAQRYATYMAQKWSRRGTPGS